MNDLHFQTTSLEQTRNQLLARLSHAHQRINRSKRLSLEDNGQSFTAMTNEERLHSIVLQHAVSRMCRVLRNSVRTALRRRLQRSLYRLKCYADTQATADKGRAIHAVEAAVFQQRITTLVQEKQELEQQHIHFEHNSQTSITTLLEEKLSLEHEKNTIREQHACLESAVENVRSRISEDQTVKLVSEAKHATLCRVFLRHALIRKFRLQQKWGLETWSQNARKTSQSARKTTQRSTAMHQMLQRWSIRTLRAWFQQWKTSQTSLGRERQAIRRLYLRSMQHSLSFNFSTWKKHVHHKTHLKYFVLQILTTRTRNAFHQWISFVHSKLQQTTGIIDMWKNWYQKALVRTFELWLKWIHHQQIQNRKFKQYFHRISNRHQQHCLAQWKVHVREMKSRKSIRVSEIKGGALSLCNVYQRCLHRRTTSTTESFSQWKKNMFNQRGIEQKMNRIQHRWGMGTVGRAFRGWCHWCQNTRQDRRTVDKFMLDWKLKKLRCRFQTWSTSTRVNQRTRTKILSFVVYLKKRQELNCMVQWKGKIKERNHCRRSWHRVNTIQHTFHRHDRLTQLRRCLTGWHQTVKYLDDKNERHQVKKRNMKSKGRTIYRLLVRQKQHLCRSCVVHWCQVHQLTLQMERKTLHVTHLWLHRHTSTCFRRWSAMVDFQKQFKRGVLLKIAKLNTSQLHHTYQKWIQQTTKRSRCRNLWTRIIHANVQRNLSQSWHRWCRSTLLLRCTSTQHSIGASVILHWWTRQRKLKLHKIWSKWKKQTFEYFKYVQLQVLLRKSIRMCRNRRLTLIFAVWWENCRENFILRKRLHNILRTACNKSLRKRLQLWKTNTMVRISSRSILRTLLTRHALHQQQRIQFGFQTWSQCSQHIRTVENQHRIKINRLQKVAHYFIHQQKTIRFDQWCKSVEEQQHNAVQRRKAICVWRHSCQMQCFSTWLDVVLRRQEITLFR